MNDGLKDVRIGDVLFYTDGKYPRNMTVLSIGRVWIKTSWQDVNIESCSLKGEASGFVWRSENSYKKWFAEKQLISSLRKKLYDWLECNGGSSDVEKLKSACNAIGIKCRN